MLEVQRRLAALHVEHLPQPVAGAIALDERVGTERVIAVQDRQQCACVIGIFDLFEFEPGLRKPVRNRRRVRPFDRHRIVDFGGLGGEFVGIFGLPARWRIDACGAGGGQRCLLVEHQRQLVAVRHGKGAVLQRSLEPGQLQQVPFGNGHYRCHRMFGHQGSKPA